MKTTVNKPKAKGSHSKFWALLKQTENYNEKYKEAIKEAWVNKYSDSKYSSLSAFYSDKPFAYQKMLQALDKEVKDKQKTDEYRNNQQRRKLLALIYETAKHKGTVCSQQEAVKIACIACDVKKLNSATEQKLIATIKSFKNQEEAAWVTSIFKQVCN